MKCSYYSGIGLIWILAIGAGWLAGDPSYYMNITSLLIVSGTCIAALLGNFGFSGSLSAIHSLISPGKATTVGFRKSAAKTVMFSGLFGGLFYLIMEVVAALGNLGDLSKLGPHLSAGLLSLLYGSFLALLMVPAYVSER
jgi:flagellar motor component MotA